MFYSDVVLSRRGDLGKVWLAAHTERKLTKSQFLSADLEECISTIAKQDAGPMSLRISGQLLLGVARIYSRKAKYLLDDCNDALSRIKTTFRFGSSDPNTDIAPAPHQAITLPATSAYAMSVPDPAFEGWDIESSVAGTDTRHSSRYAARQADTNLPQFLGSSPGWGSNDFFDPNGSRPGSAEHASPVVERRDSQGRLVDANGDLLEEGDSFSSVGVGRDAPPQTARPSLPGADFSGLDDLGAESFLMPDTDLGGGLDLGLEEFEAQRQRSSTPDRPSPATMHDLSPRTALKVQKAAEKRASSARRMRKHVIDSQTEIDETLLLPQSDAQVAERQLLSSSRAQIHLLDIRRNPNMVLHPFTQIDSTGILTLRSVQHYAPQITELFTFDSRALRRQRTRVHENEWQSEGEGEGEDDDDVLADSPLHKRIRTSEPHDDFASEIGRRVQPQAQDVSLPLGDISHFDDFPADDFDDGGLLPFNVEPMDTEEQDGVPHTTTAPRRSQRKRAPQAEPVERALPVFPQMGSLHRLSTPSEQEGNSPTPSHPLRAFERIVEASTPSGATTPQPFALSKSSMRAVNVLKQELQNNRSVSFHSVTRNTSRRAAAGFFFEMLALGTKDCIQVKQAESFGDIQIAPKPAFSQLTSLL